MLTLDDFDFVLPPELIAQHPAAERSSGRLLNVTGKTLFDQKIADLPQLVRPGDLLVFNDTRVIKARLLGKKESGGQVEVMIERIIDSRHVLAQIRASKPPKQDSRIVLEDAFTLRIVERLDEKSGFYALELEGDGDIYALLEQYGRLPLPPYIVRPADNDDDERYQTVYARHPGAVAAPTAGLHFDETLLSQIEDRGAEIAWLTLHIGAGTFQPVRVHRILEHRMHSERFNIPQATADAIDNARKRGGRVIAVGTTSLRALEAAGQTGRVQPGSTETDIFITPGYRFRIVDCLVTNFHLPRSTLLMLVYAFAGSDLVRNAYEHAISERYHFFSYGDATFLERHDDAF